MLLLDKMLSELYENTEEKIVLVSNYTSTLDMLEMHCDKQRYRSLRLDGSTPQKTRQELVDSFNRTSQKHSFLFLLSSKAGGVGLNLIGSVGPYLLGDVVVSDIYSLVLGQSLETSLI